MKHSGQRIGGRDFDITVGDLTLTVSKATLGITDNVEVAHDKGVPNGWVAGSVSSEGEIELTAAGMKILGEAASSAGSWRELPEFDMLFFAKTGSGEELKVEAFACKMKVDGLLDIDANENTKMHMTKLKFIVTSPDFVHINGTPYLSKAETEGIVRPGE
ncbi:phage protein [Desulfovibrio cuneatus]|uniref:phage protein n=1 Tax=Desulfovibrio cuneatus TaxID=159728 RepID=UPI0003F7E7B5|nr:phage protein [Desulfovibrio cuneatus]